jgi:hypothetical protein
MPAATDQRILCTLPSNRDEMRQGMAESAFSQNTLGSSTRAFRDEALLSPLISTSRNGLRGQAAVRSPGALRLHPAFNELNLADWLIHSESQEKPKDVREPILITNQGILLAGFAEWHAAVSAGQNQIDCVELALNADEAMQLILDAAQAKSCLE